MESSDPSATLDKKENIHVEPLARIALHHMRLLITAPYESHNDILAYIITTEHDEERYPSLRQVWPKASLIPRPVDYTMQ